MSNHELVNILIGAAVVALLVVRQMRTRRVKEDSAARITAILGVIGIIELVDAGKGHHVGAATIAWIVLTLVVGAALGAVRAVTVRIWRTAEGPALRKGTALTAVLWVVSLGLHLGMESLIDHSSGIAGFGSAGLLLYLAVTLGVQREIVRWRASRVTVTPA
ncbi:MAG: hypothetical protein ABR925_08065 [Acidimicrobiales bacterium]|jgi:hypothetical protein